jgi:hypothetical protein
VVEEEYAGKASASMKDLFKIARLQPEQDEFDGGYEVLEEGEIPQQNGSVKRTRAGGINQQPQQKRPRVVADNNNITEIELQQ